MEITGILVVILIFFAIALLMAAIRIAKEYERAVIFRLGRLIGQKGPGLFLLIPVIDRMVKVDLRIVTMNVPPQEVITKDNVPAKVNAVVYFKVMEPNQAIVEVENYIMATSQIAQTTLRSTLGQADLDHLLAERDKINQQLQTIIDDQTAPWGIKVVSVEVKDVEIPKTMQRAMARQAEAERERRAKIIAAEGEFQASEKLSNAAKVLAVEPVAVQLRFLQTLTEVAAEHNSTTIFPVPIDLLSPFMDKAKHANRDSTS
jgi:regulator of protease activity HflC (stomatin/prohibitin superfamily)